MMAIMEKQWRNDISKDDVRLINPELEVVTSVETSLGLLEEYNTSADPVVRAGELVTVWGVGWCSFHTRKRARRVKLVATVDGKVGWLFHEECDPVSQEVSDGG